ncbi:MAG: threonylcarbamoyl-AMP synthase [Bacteroidetes bacterium]|nr:threonylcarbamoyl-AMP synthase [Bacteroidota bacterium]
MTHNKAPKIGIDIENAKQILQVGGLVAIPTETVYGLAANALNEQAVLKIFEAKNRPYFDPLIIHSNSIEKIKAWVLDFPLWAQQLAQAFWPGPLTLLLPKKNTIPDVITSGLPQVAVRIPNHALTLQLLKSIDFPLAAPSANPFGYISPTQPQHVWAQLQHQVAYILDGGVCEVGLESTIVGFDEGLVVYRLGGLAVEDIERVAGPVQVQTNNSSNPKAPGMIKSHYAPKKPLFIADIASFLKTHADKKVGIISFYQSYGGQYASVEKILSPKKNIKEAAHGLFAALRYFDESDVEVIVSEKFPDSFLGRAINDRLQRAAAK